MTILQTHCNFKDVLEKPGAGFLHLVVTILVFPTLVSEVTGSGNVCNSDAKKLRNMKHNECVFLTPNGQSAESEV